MPVTIMILSFDSPVILVDGKRDLNEMFVGRVQATIFAVIRCQIIKG